MQPHDPTQLASLAEAKMEIIQQFGNSHKNRQIAFISLWAFLHPTAYRWQPDTF